MVRGDRWWCHSLSSQSTCDVTPGLHLNTRWQTLTVYTKVSDILTTTVILNAMHVGVWVTCAHM